VEGQDGNNKRRPVSSDFRSRKTSFPFARESSQSNGHDREVQNQSQSFLLPEIPKVHYEVNPHNPKAADL
jgi:hypothetical protein